MTIRISKEFESGKTILRVDGRLCSENVCALSSEYHELDGPVALELSELQSADSVGVATLLEYASSGAELRGTSGYVEMLLSKNNGGGTDTLNGTS